MRGNLMKYDDETPWLVLIEGKLLQLPLHPDDVKTIEEDMLDYPNINYGGERVDVDIIPTTSIGVNGEVVITMTAKLTDALTDITIDDVAESFYNKCTYVFKDKLTECSEFNGVIELMLEFAKSDAVKQYHLNNNGSNN